MLAALYSLWTLYGAGPEAFWWGMALFALGLPLYFLMKWQATPPTPRRRSRVAAVICESPSCNAIRATTSCSSLSASVR